MLAEVRSAANGAVLVESALVVTIHDGRLGFVVASADADRVLAAGEVTLSAPGRTVTGAVDVVRSGSAFEEVRGRTRQASGGLARLVGRLRPPTTVVVVRVDPETGSG